MTQQQIRDWQLERAQLIDRLSQAYRLIGPAALYVRFYGEDGEHRVAARKLGREMQEYFDAGLFGDKEEASK